jgi:hypothetical protein
MSAEDQKLLFQPFMQIRPGELQKGRGSGLGLSICKTIVTLHGGVIGCHSKQRVGEDKESGGSDFFFSVPFDIYECHCQGQCTCLYIEAVEEIDDNDELDMDDEDLDVSELDEEEEEEEEEEVEQYNDHHLATNEDFVTVQKNEDCGETFDGASFADGDTTECSSISASVRSTMVQILSYSDNNIAVPISAIAGQVDLHSRNSAADNSFIEERARHDESNTDSDGETSESSGPSRPAHSMVLASTGDKKNIVPEIATDKIQQSSRIAPDIRSTKPTARTDTGYVIGNVLVCDGE